LGLRSRTSGRPSLTILGAVFGVLEVALGIEMVASGLSLWASAPR